MVQRISSYDGTPIAFTDEGSREGSPVLMINGLGGRATAFGPLMGQLPGRRAISWDYRGLFDSGRPVRGYAGLKVVDHARDGLALLDALEIEQAHLLGWSMGVQVALEMTLIAPDRVKSLALMGGASGNPYRTLGGLRGVDRIMPSVLRRLQRVDHLVARVVATAADMEAFIPLMIRLGLVHHDLDRAVFTRLAKGFKKLDMHLYLELLQKLGEHDVQDRLGEIERASLIIVGSEDVLTPLDAARSMAEGIPGGQLQVIAGGTHYAAVEMPEVVARHLERFWSKTKAKAPIIQEASLA